MKGISTLGLVGHALLLQSVSASVLNARAKCNADNCARAATGTFQGFQATRNAACSSFQQCTVIPATQTLTNTVTIIPDPLTTTYTVNTVVATQVIQTTVTFTPGLLDKRAELYGGLPVGGSKRGVEARDVATTICPTAVPATASACSGSVRYASACSCAGVTKSYTTVSAPTTEVTVSTILDPATTTIPATLTIVVTDIATATVTATPFTGPTNFNVQLNFPAGSDANSAQYQGLFLAMDNGFGEISSRPQSSAIAFTLNSQKQLTNVGSTGADTDHFDVAVTIGSATFMVWDTLQHYRASHVNYPFTTCTSIPSVLVPGSAQLQCSGSSGRVPAICDANQWNSMGGAGTRTDSYFVLFSPGASHAGCYNFELTQVGI